MTKISILTYTQKHRKTYDTLCLLRTKGYDKVTVFAQPMSYQKKRKPLIVHRPELIINIPEPRELCDNLGYEYVEGNFQYTIGNERKDDIFLLCGAGLLPHEVVCEHRIINSHPGYIPYARGLDAYKWSIYYGLPIGVTTHFLGKYVDAGEIIERRKIKVNEYDTFHSVAQRLYENEIDMLVGAIRKIDEEHRTIIPTEANTFRRMPQEKEKSLYAAFERYRNTIENDLGG